jgi:molybdate transport system substrate-binding protein
VKRLLALLLLLLAVPAAAAPPVVLAAASLQEALTEAADVWTRAGHERPVISFASSGALAKQIDAGAPADLFLSADEPWMDDVAGRKLIRPGTRVTLLTNRLVLIAPVTTRGRVAIRPGFPLARLLGTGRLAIGDPASVPAGKYGREALTKLGVWGSVEAKVAAADNVRSAMTLVERGEAPYGIVYATDALASKGVRVAGAFPPASHTPITYPIALLTASASAEAEPFRRFLLSAPAKAIFRRHGFGTR